MKKQIWCVLGVFLGVLLMGSLPVSAKDLSSRLGVGFTDQAGLSSSMPSLSARYYPNADMGIQASLGVDTENDRSRFGFSAKVFRIVFAEDNMNFYMGAGAGLVSQERSTGGTDSGFELSGFGGGEFFFSGLENLRFSFEMGVGVTSISSSVRFRTIGDGPFRAGVIFYF